MWKSIKWKRRKQHWIQFRVSKIVWWVWAVDWVLRVHSECPSGLSKNENTGECEDIDECEGTDVTCDMETQVCHNVVGSYKCLDITSPDITAPVPTCPHGHLFNKKTIQCDGEFLLWMMGIINSGEILSFLSDRYQWVRNETWPKCVRQWQGMRQHARRIRLRRKETNKKSDDEVSNANANHVIVLLHSFDLLNPFQTTFFNRIAHSEATDMYKGLSATRRQMSR